MSRLYSAESLCQAWEMESLDISIDFFLFIFFYVIQTMMFCDLWTL